MSKKKCFMALLGVFFTSLLTVGFCSLNGMQSVGAQTLETPIVWSISDAVKPNETVVIQGYGLTGADLAVAYAPNAGAIPTAFDETDLPENCKFIPKSQLTAVDETNGSGIALILPNSIPCGTYDFWVKANGAWSNGVTLNATRPLYLNQEGAYAGLPVEIVGRNFFRSEYGLGTNESSLAGLRVKLVRVADVNGNSDGVQEEKTVGVESGVRYTAEQSVTGKAIEKSNPYKITFVTPTVQNYGTYEVFVAADGVDFRPLEEKQRLIIYEKKAQNWDESVFGALSNNTHIGNDPLDLLSYWAQDFNYVNVETMAPNTPSDTTLVTKVAQAAYRLYQKGGGVVYFPEGSYYLTYCASFYENVIWVGAGADKTTIYYPATNTGGGSWIKANGTSRVGFARMSFAQEDPQTQAYPDGILVFADTAGKTADGAADASLQTSKNKFVTDVTFDFPFDTAYADGTAIANQRRMCLISGAKNFVYQNVVYRGGSTPMKCGVYEYVNIRNARLQSNDANADMGVTANYAFLENVSFEKDWHGHGISLRNNASVSNCYVTKTGDPSWVGNIGEALVFEPAPGFFSTGMVLSATARTFTVTMLAGTEITNAAPALSYDNFAVQIVGGKGCGQMRYFKRAPLSNNCYELLDGEKDWEIIPDATSRYTVIIPMRNATVYRFKAENCVKGIYLYSQLYDAVVAECELINTEGILLSSVSIPYNGRFNSNGNVRIVNNRIQGVSVGSNKGGINVRLDTVGDGNAKGFGTLIQGVTVKGNVLENVKPKTDHTGVTATEQSAKCGIVVDYSGGYSTATDSFTDLRFVVVENNRVVHSQYGVYYEVSSVGVVVRNNTATENENSFYVAESRIQGAYVLDGIETIDGNETEKFPIEFEDPEQNGGNQTEQQPPAEEPPTEEPPTEQPPTGQQPTGQLPTTGGNTSKSGCAGNVNGASLAFLWVGTVLAFLRKRKEK